MVNKQIDQKKILKLMEEIEEAQTEYQKALDQFSFQFLEIKKKFQSRQEESELEEVRKSL